MLQLNMRVGSNARKCSSPRQRGGIGMRIACGIIAAAPDDGHHGDLYNSCLLRIFAPP